MVIALILSGGTGSRLGGDIPKQYIEVAGKPLIAYSLDVLIRHEGIDRVQIVADVNWQDYIRGAVQSDKPLDFSLPGKTRQLSIFNGLSDIREYAEDEDIVFIHDAARPNLTSDMISNYIKSMQGHDGLMPVLPMKDTVYHSLNGNRVDGLLKRSEIVAGQAPELFLLGKYYEANRLLLPEDILSINGASEPAVMAGMDIAIVSGDENNYKITTAADFDRFEKSIRK